MSLALAGFLLALVIWLYLLIVRRREEGYYSTLCIFGLGALIYFFAIPIEFELLGLTFFAGPSGNVDMGPDIRGSIIGAALLAIPGFLLGLLFGRMPPELQMAGGSATHIESSNATTRHWCIALALSLMLSIAAVLAFFGPLLLQAGDYAGAFSSRSQSPTYALLIELIALSAAVLGACSMRSRNTLIVFCGVLTLALPAMLGLYLSDKNSLVLSALGVAAGVGVRLTKRLLFFPFLAVATATVVVWLIPFFSFIRANIPLDRALDLLLRDTFSFTTIDPRGPMVSLSETLSRQSPLELGATYLVSLTVLVPRFLWPERPPDLAESFAQVQILSWQPGMGLGFSPLAEAYMNFGVIGAWAHFFIFGFLWALVWRLFSVMSPFKERVEVFQIFYLVLGYYALLLSFRGSLIPTIKVVMLSALPLLTAYLLVRGVSTLLSLANRKYPSKNDMQDAI